MRLLRWSLTAVLAGSVACSSGNGERGIEGDNGGGSNGGASAGSTAGSNGANGGNASNGSNGDDAGSSSPYCDERTVRNDRVTPDMLIVLDRSGSMAPNGNPEKVDRWKGSVDGIDAITTALDATIEFGLMTYPSDDSCGAGKVDVPIAPMNASNINGALANMSADGSTPTAQSLAAAHQALGMLPATSPDELPHPKYVLLVTDGSPNCLTGGGGGNPFQCFLDPDPQACLQMQLATIDTGAVDATVKEIEAMAKDGIKTYVIGFGTKSVPNLAAALDKMAAAGDTGDTQHRPVEDKASLVKAFEEIAGSAISCDYVLKEAPEDASYVEVKVDGTQINLNDPSGNGWTLSADRTKVTVTGSYCKTLQDGQKHTLDVKVLCTVVNPV